MASEIPLLLFGCDYPTPNGSPTHGGFRRSEEHLEGVIEKLRHLARDLEAKLAVIREIIAQVKKRRPENTTTTTTKKKKKVTRYIQLLDREREPAFEPRLKMNSGK